MGPFKKYNMGPLKKYNMGCARHETIGVITSHHMHALNPQ